MIAVTAAYLDAHAALYGTLGKSIPANWRERLPDAAEYYSRHVQKLGTPNGNGWASCVCRFHKDTNPSASVNLSTGGFRCHGCGEHGDLIAFHRKLTGMDFKAAVRDLIGLRP